MLLALKRRLHENDVAEEEKQAIRREIEKLEIAMDIR